MSFKRLDPEDFVVSAESIAGALWSNGSPTAPSFEAGDDGLPSSRYYVNAFLDTTNANAGTPKEFSVSYGNIDGLGAAPFDPEVEGYSPTSVVYGQFQNIVLGDEDTKFTWGGAEQDDFYAVTFTRNRFKEKILPGNWSFEVTNAGSTETYVDASKITPTISFNEAGRVFPIYRVGSGSPGAPSNTNTSYGLFLPDIGVMLLDTALAPPGLDADDEENPAKLIAQLKNFTVNFQETITSDFVFIRARNAEYNYSENPSFISGSTGAVVYNDFINNPQTFVTSVGLYNDTNDLLAIAKLSTPLKKDFTKEALIRVKLDF